MFSRFTLLICLLFGLFSPVNSIAQTDSVYSRMTLGSSDYTSQPSMHDKYARSRTALIQLLKSEQLAEGAVRSCFVAQHTELPEGTAKAHAKKCATSLKITRISGDTVSLAFGNPKISGLVPATYLNNLMQALLEDNILHSFRANRKQQDSLRQIFNSTRENLYKTGDTLYSFRSAPEFTSEAKRTLNALTDTVNFMKSAFYTFHYDSTVVQNIFRYTDALLAELQMEYTDSVSPYWQDRVANANARVFQTNLIVSEILSGFNAVMVVVGDTSINNVYRDQQQKFYFELFEEQLNGEAIRNPKRTPSIRFNSPIAGKKYPNVLTHYYSLHATYSNTLTLSTRCALDRSAITVSGQVICWGSTVKC